MRNRSFRWRKLEPHQEAAVASAAAAGVSKNELAEQYGVTRRTIYRTIERAASQEWREVRLAGYVARFVLTDDGPIQRGPWVADRAA